MEAFWKGLGDGSAVAGGPVVHSKVRLSVEKKVLALRLSPLFDRLSLTKNQLTSIPDSIGSLTDLKWFAIRSLICPLASILIALFDRLNLEQNQLTSLPDCIGFLTNLIQYGICCVI